MSGSNRMAPLLAMIKTLMAAAALLAALATAQAATFSARRGLNLDQWVTWPGADRWADAETMLPYPEWRKFLGEAELKALKDAGFDFLRMPVDPSPFLAADNAALHDRLYAGVLDSARMINRAGIKVVVDLHLIAAGANRGIGMGEVMRDPAAFDRYVEVVRRMARTLSGEDPALVAFEPMNEPVVDCEADGTDLWPERQRRLFAAARASATRLTLVLTGGCYSSAAALARMEPKDIPDDNLVWTFHSYEPFLLTHQGAGWTGDFMPYVIGLPYPLDALPRAGLDAALDAIRAGIRKKAPFARRHGLDLAQFHEVLLSGQLACDLLRAKVPLLEKGEFPPQAAIRNVCESSRLVVETAKESGVPAPLAEVSLALNRAAVDLGFGDEDMIAVVKAYEAMGGGPL